MKIKDLIKGLREHDPETEVVLRPLYQNPTEPTYCMKKIRVYRSQDRVIVDGYEREIERGY